tara:strand:- start:1086 stop:1535 length:450 start_codon:yes stop_codon:yes gene_type:complete
MLSQIKLLFSRIDSIEKAKYLQKIAIHGFFIEFIFLFLFPMVDYEIKHPVHFIKTIKFECGFGGEVCKSSYLMYLFVFSSSLFVFYIIYKKLIFAFPIIMMSLFSLIGYLFSNLLYAVIFYIPINIMLFQSIRAYFFIRKLNRSSLASG